MKTDNAKNLYAALKKELTKNAEGFAILKDMSQKLVDYASEIASYNASGKEGFPLKEYAAAKKMCQELTGKEVKKECLDDITTETIKDIYFSRGRGIKK